jgi:hypothetical protein
MESGVMLVSIPEVAVEEWRDIPGYEGRYQVSDMGNVKSLARKDRRGVYWPERLRKVSPEPSGHLSVCLSFDNKTRTLSVHRLVLLAFVGPPPEGTEACHKNGKPDDNRLENLYWGTRKQNQQDSIRHGTKAYGRQFQSGHAPYRTKLTRDDVRAIRASTESHAELAEKYGVHRTTISDIRRGKIWANVK